MLGRNAPLSTAAATSTKRETDGVAERTVFRYDRSSSQPQRDDYDECMQEQRQQRCPAAAPIRTREGCMDADAPRRSVRVRFHQLRHLVLSQDPYASIGVTPITSTPAPRAISIAPITSA